MSKKNSSHHYADLIKHLLEQYALLDKANEEQGVETHTIFDDVTGRYMLFRIGWWRKKRVRSPLVYARVQNDKIWIEEDWTEEGVVPTLLANGVPHESIVLGFRHPRLRPLTEFAVA
jgi:hypothetical protein